MGAAVETQTFDLRDTENMLAELAAADARHALDFVILNAGLGGSVPGTRLSEDPLVAKAMADINFAAPVTAASLAADLMAGAGPARSYWSVRWRAIILCRWPRPMREPRRAWPVLPKLCGCAWPNMTWL